MQIRRVDSPVGRAGGRGKVKMIHGFRINGRNATPTAPSKAWGSGLPSNGPYAKYAGHNFVIIVSAPLFFFRKLKSNVMMQTAEAR